MSNTDGAKLKDLRLPKEACRINGEPHYTARAIGEFFGYKCPRETVHNIVKRHPQIKEFSREASLLSAKGQEHRTQVFNLGGLYLMSAASQSKQALDFQIAMAMWLADQMPPLAWVPSSRESAIQQILSHPPTQKRRALVADLASQEGKTQSTVYRWLKKAGGLKNHKGDRRKSRAVKPSEWPSERIAAIERILNHPATAERIGLIRELAAREGVCKATVHRWVRRVGELEPYKGHPRKGRTPKPAAPDSR